MDAYTESVADLLHQELCNDSPSCARRDAHREYYLDKARSIISQLEPEIGYANVYEAVRVILKEIN